MNGHAPFLSALFGGNHPLLKNGFGRFNWVDMLRFFHYKAKVADEVVYMEDGTLQAKAGSAHADEYGKAIANVGLNCTNLKDIRRLWHLFSDDEEVDLEANLNNKSQRFLSLMQVLYLDEDKIEQDNKIQKNYIKYDYWRTFLMYHWFHKKL